MTQENSPRWIGIAGARAEQDVLISSMAARIAARSATVSGAKRAVSQATLDEERMAALVAFTARSLGTERPVPFGCSIVHTRSGKLLLRALNAVTREFDPSAHAEGDSPGD